MELIKIDFDQRGPVLYVKGADILDGSAIFDIKPYIPYCDSKPDAKGSFAEENKDYRLSIHDPKDLLSIFSDEKRETLLKTLSLDPRPAYHGDPSRVYGFAYAGYDVRFTVDGGNLTVFEIVKT